MSAAEQPSVETLVERVRLAFNDWIATDDPVAVQDALAALDSLTAALGRAERELALERSQAETEEMHLRNVRERMNTAEARAQELEELLGEDAGAAWFNLKARARKAEAERDELRDLIHELRDDLARWIPALTTYDEPPTGEGPSRLERLRAYAAKRDPYPDEPPTEQG